MPYPQKAYAARTSACLTGRFGELSRWLPRENSIASKSKLREESVCERGYTEAIRGEETGWNGPGTGERSDQLKSAWHRWPLCLDWLARHRCRKMEKVRHWQRVNGQLKPCAFSTAL